MNHDYALVISAGGAVISFVAMLCVGVIGFLIKHVLSTFDKRLDSVETKTESHGNHISSAIAQTESEKKVLAELQTSVSAMRDRIETLSTQIATLLGSMVKPSRARR